uniref:Transmembrane protein n=1 Tax=Arundo donax TaxID=35708 RepID=A0A0A8XQS9_ARUDO
MKSCQVNHHHHHSKMSSSTSHKMFPMPSVAPLCTTKFMHSLMDSAIFPLFIAFWASAQFFCIVSHIPFMILTIGLFVLFGLVALVLVLLPLF